MSQADLDRIRDDIETIKYAAGVGLPFGRDDVKAGLWCAACGLLIVAWSLLSPWEYRWLVHILLFLAALACVRAYASARRQRHQEPVRWREQRLNLIASVVAVPLAIGYMFWERQVGIPRGVSGAASMFFVGVGLAVFAMLDRRRLHFLGAAIPLMAFGLAIPLCSPPRIVLAAGLCMAVGSLASAGIQAWQLRQMGRDQRAH